MQDQSNDRLMTSGEVAAVFRVNRKTVARWAQDGKIVTCFRTPGGHRRFREADVRALVNGDVR
jgi:excisionase family DNA binding protein